MTSSFWTDARLTRIGIVVLIGIIIALPIAFFSDELALSMLRSGDFPGFYVQGEILRRGLAHELYNPELQRAIENEAWPSFGGAFYMAVYPPYTAVALYPLSLFSPQIAQFIFTAFMGLLYIGAFQLLTRINSTLTGRAFAIGAITLFASTMMTAIFGAQNTALSMAIGVAAMWCLKYPSQRNNLFTGVLLGLWAFKPQYALFGFVFAILISPSRQLLLGFTATGTVLYAIGALVLGTLWPLTWLAAIKQFGALNYIHNRQEMLSLIGASKALAYNLNVDTTLFSLAGYLLTALLLVFTLRAMRCEEHEPWKRFALGLSLMPLLSPQTLFYDLGIGICGLVALMNFRSDRNIWIYLSLISLSTFSFLVRESSPIPPFFHLALIVGALSVWIFRRKAL